LQVFIDFNNISIWWN